MTQMIRPPLVLSVSVLALLLSVAGIGGSVTPEIAEGLLADPTNKFTRVAAPSRANLRADGSESLATVNVTYIGFESSPAAQIAFQRAVDIWASLLVTPVPLTIRAEFAPLSPGTLGGARAGQLFRDFTNAPVANVWYPVGVANRLSGVDLDPSGYDIEASFSTSAPWYFGTDGNTPANSYDFVSTVLHEIGHGLGIAGSMRVTSGVGSWGLGSGFPFIYDWWAMNGSGQFLTDSFLNPSTTLAAQLQSNNLFWGGPLAFNANGSSFARLYAPATFIPGSSFSHLDESAYPPGNINSLMTYALGQAESIHNPGPISIGILRDIGWSTSCSFALSYTSIGGSAAGGTGSVGVIGPSGCAWTATSNVAFVSITAGSSGTGSGSVQFAVATNPLSAARSGTITAAGNTFTVNQTGITCSLGVSATGQNVAAAATSGSVNVMANAADCPWTAVSNVSWLTVTSASSGSGNGAVTFGVAQNFEFAQRVGTLSLAGQTFTVTQAAATSCAFGLSTGAISMSAAGGSSGLSVTTGAACDWTAVSDAAWVTITSGTPGSGTGNVGIQVAPNLTVAARVAILTVAGHSVSVTQAGPCSFAVSTTTATAPSGGLAGSVTVSAGTGCAWTAVSNAPWISVSSGGSGSGNGLVLFAVTLNSSVSTRVGTLTVAGHTVTITQLGAVSVSIDRSSLNFAAVSSGMAFVSSTAAQSIRLVQSGTGNVTWTAASNVPWLVVSPNAGSGTSVLTASVQFSPGLPATTTGSITISVTGAANAVPPVVVRLNVAANGASTAPVGSFDTPLDGTTGVTGSIGVTGWAMDDVQVARIRIERDPVVGEASGARVYIGDASFVDGARPDVGAGFPTSPMNTRAGWGYLLLTNFLPNLGNGTFTLYAVAEDADGHTTLLGTKTITCTNATATNPFGAIDTPGQGATVSGIVNNFGWVLSPGSRRADPLHGGTVLVVIDGAIVGSPSGWVSRPDLSALFPASQFSGIGNALGVYTFDSTTLTNGVHTISWVVTDDQGGAAGIGSRYFTVSNGAGLQLAPQATSALSGSGLSPRRLSGRRGPEVDSPFAPLSPDAEGVIGFAAEELDRIELRLHASGGYLRSAMGSLPLPIGSRIDPTEGTFTWQAGPGFIGAYDLVFDTLSGQQTVRVTLYPQGMLTRPQVVIDTPTELEELPGTFTVAGWAVDPRADPGNGVDAIHVWAYPVGGGMPVFLGATTLTGNRPDVASIYGVRGLKSGYGITAASLPSGTYDLAVFAWSSQVNGFLPATTRRVVVR